jgi:aldehyde dehydrogenase (NAD+)
LVNEFVRKEFIQHSLKYAIRFMAATESTTSSKISGNTKSSPVASTLSSLSASKSWNLSTITRGDSSAIVELSALSQLPPKISQPLLCIASITSLEHAISLIEAENNKLLVAYHFGTPQAGKYLAQFVPSDVSFINHVPFSLLLGPAAPASHPIICISRYSVEMFSRLKPAYITPPAAQAALSNALSDENGRKASAELLGAATMEIKEKKRQESIAIGYFEQGIFIGLGVYGIPILTCLGATVFFGLRAGLRRWVFA